jgi:hypothetical protein
MEKGDRVVWIGDEEERTRGTSGKVWGFGLDREEVIVDWGGHPTAAVAGKEVASCAEAARLGIEPWASTHPTWNDDQAHELMLRAYLAGWRSRDESYTPNPETDDSAAAEKCEDIRLNYIKEKKA